MLSLSARPLPPPPRRRAPLIGTLRSLLLTLSIAVNRPFTAEMYPDYGNPLRRGDEGTMAGASLASTGVPLPRLASSGYQLTGTFRSFDDEIDG